MQTRAATIFEQMTALSDATRSRLLLVLERHELTVGELCAILQLPQSTVSRHLKVLGDEAWVSSRAEGTSRRYVMVSDLDPAAKKLWRLVREQVGETTAAMQDAQRVQGVLAQRRTRSQEFFSTSAGNWDRLRAELFGRRADLHSLLGLLDDDLVVGDLGCGTGQVSESLARFVLRVIAVDSSSAMLAAARRRLEDVTNVDLRSGDLESLPVEDGELDAAVVFLVMHYLVDPARALAEASRALKTGGRLLIVDMMPHEREELRTQMGHVWAGFTDEQVLRWMSDAGLARCRYIPLPADPEAKGPTLFSAVGRKA
jgi:ubiquinone/menaquinone biosynthesis C-methylase UbiE